MTAGGPPPAGATQPPVPPDAGPWPGRTGSVDRPLELAGATSVVWTDRRHGDLGARALGDVDGRRRAVIDRPWCWLDQVHGPGVEVLEGTDTVTGRPGDALVWAPGRGPGKGPALAIFTADCAPVALGSSEGVMGAVHAGWAGLRAGVIAAAVSAMQARGATEVVAALGPCVHPECYEFSPADLDRMAERFGPGVAARTASGQPALDLPGAVSLALAEAGAELVFRADVCTACSPWLWSHRARRDPERQAMVVWPR